MMSAGEQRKARKNQRNQAEQARRDAQLAQQKAEADRAKDEKNLAATAPIPSMATTGRIAAQKAALRRRQSQGTGSDSSRLMVG